MSKVTQGTYVRLTEAERDALSIHAARAQRTLSGEIRLAIVSHLATLDGLDAKPPESIEQAA